MRKKEAEPATKIKDGAEVGPLDDINMAVRDLQANGGGTLFLRRGNYRVAELRIPEGVTLRAKENSLGEGT